MTLKKPLKRTNMVTRIKKRYKCENVVINVAQKNVTNNMPLNAYA